jgi:hypothetical protein
MLHRLAFVAPVVVSVSLAAALAFAGPKPPPPTCADALGTNAYRCTSIAENNPQPNPFCLQASAPAGSEQFDLSFLNTSGPCNCNPTGSGKKLKFRASQHAFVCNVDGVVLTGKVGAKGQKITAGVAIAATIEQGIAVIKPTLERAERNRAA